MKVLDLFSGIGGFSIGLEKAGFETVAFCEIEDYPRAVLRKHWPDTPIYRDIKKLTAEQLRADRIFPDVICGGYPCQPFSVAGKQLAEQDERHLFPEVLRLVQSIRPRWCIFENVSGHVKLGFDQVASSLEDEGYSVWPFIIPACAVDAPHRRDRLWIVAHTRNKPGWDSFQRGAGAGSTPEAMANTDSFGLQGCAQEQISRVGNIQEQSQGSGTNFGDGWPVESRVGRVANGIPNRAHRIKTLGNAVVPQIPEIIGQTIMRYEMEVNNVI
jgi:DNA (cytosine-5)-methyltransferase 1